MVVLDPMHSLFLVLTKHHFRDILGIDTGLKGKFVKEVPDFGDPSIDIESLRPCTSNPGNSPALRTEDSDMNSERITTRAVAETKSNINNVNERPQRARRVPMRFRDGTPDSDLEPEVLNEKLRPEDQARRLGVITEETEEEGTDNERHGDETEVGP